MAVTLQTLIESKQAENAQTTQYTTPSQTRSIIDKFTATNTTVTPATLTVNLIPSGGSAGSSNVITYSKSIAAGDVYTFPELIGHTLQPGDIISTIAGTASALTIRASGREVV